MYNVFILSIKLVSGHLSVASTATQIQSVIHSAYMSKWNADLNEK